MKKLFLVSLLLISFGALCQPKIPDLWGSRIHDEAGVLSAQFVHDLEVYLQRAEDTTSNQIGILIIPSLDDYPIEEYTLAVAEKWKLGQQGKDNGVLIFLAIEDRKVRIEVGYGLEGVLTDALSNQIIRNEMAPYFRQNNYEGGIVTAVQAIQLAIKGEYKAEPKNSGRRRGGRSFLPILVIFAVLFLMSMFRGGGRGGRRGGGWSSRGGWFGPVIFGGGGGFGRGGGFGGGGFSGGGGGFGGGGSSGSW